tara:strand:- start:60463 stop:60930 length:468 start_codon:yes stop_codon:yes gene_type:complete
MKITERQLRKVIRKQIILSEGRVRLHTETNKLLKYLRINTRKLSPEQKANLNQLVIDNLSDRLGHHYQKTDIIFQALDATGLWPRGDYVHDQRDQRLTSYLDDARDKFQTELKRKERYRRNKELDREATKAGRKDMRRYAKSQIRQSRAAPGWRD